jgi:hypothetical protein
MIGASTRSRRGAGGAVEESLAPERGIGLLERRRSAAAEDFHPFGLAEPGERAGAESAPLTGGGKRPFCGKPAGQSGRFETEGFAGMRGRAGPLPLPPGGMLCEFTRPTPH